MAKKNSDKEIPYYFLISDDYILGTSRGIAASERTIDIPFHNLANNYELQEKLKLLSAVFIKPWVRPPLAYPLYGEKLIRAAAAFLSEFGNTPDEKKQRRDYLVNNGIVRILVKNDSLMGDIERLANS